MADPRLVSFLAAAGADVLLTADPGLVRMLTGHSGDIATGPSPFALPALVLAPGDGEPILVCSADEAPEGDAVETFEGFTVAPLDTVGRAAAALDRALARVGGGRVLVDGASVPAGLAARVGDAALAGPELGTLGAVKTPDEVVAIEAALRLCEAGQAAARQASFAGAGELEVWGALRTAIEVAAGGPTPLVADLLCGPRTAEAGGPPGARTLAEGDLVLCDLVPRLDGTWGDSCATWAVGEPSDEARRLHGAARAALEAALDVLRPGATGGEVDTVARHALAAEGFDYPHHTGHGVGFHYHEEPRAVPGGLTVLEPGMVVALEPGGYVGELGLRLEVVALVTDGAPRVLSRHALDLDRDASGGAA